MTGGGAGLNFRRIKTYSPFAFFYKILLGCGGIFAIAVIGLLSLIVAKNTS